MKRNSDKDNGVRTTYTSLFYNTLMWMMKTNVSFTEEVVVFFRIIKYKLLKKMQPSASANTAVPVLLVYSIAHFFCVTVLQADIPPKYYIGMG